MNKKIIFQTEDGVEIVGEYREAPKEAPWVLLLHMMPVTRVSFYPFMDKLREAGFSSLAIDFRGHGESIKKFQISDFRLQNAPEMSVEFEASEALRAQLASLRARNGNEFTVLDYKKFTDEEQQDKIFDVRAAVRWLEKNKGVSKDRLVFVGASIGANLTLQYMVENPEIKKGVLLSPGLNYRGVKTDMLVKKLYHGQRVLLLASSDDTHGSFESIRELNRLNPHETEKWEFSGLDHGTTMFERKPELMDEVLDWLKN